MSTTNNKQGNIGTKILGFLILIALAVAIQFIIRDGINGMVDNRERHNRTHCRDSETTYVGGENGTVCSGSGYQRPVNSDYYDYNRP